MGDVICALINALNCSNNSELFPSYRLNRVGSSSALNILVEISANEGYIRLIVCRL